jgi:hypothetical protein
MTAAFAYIPERDDPFLSLFPHRYDFIYAPHPELGERPQWQTESRYPLSDRLIQQGAHLYGVRFGAQTQYCLLDIDIGSAYHPQQDPLAIHRLLAALEPLGLVSYLACTSSNSQGLHLYFPLGTPQSSWQLATALTTQLECQGFKCRPGHLEVFPNPKLYVVDGTPNHFNAHRLPLQTGSYLLNADWEPTAADQLTFAQQWCWCQRRNTLDASVLESVLQQSYRRHHRVSQRADKFLNDLNADIEPGWTGSGQTNYLLGRITLRTYIFHHVIHGGLPLNGEDLVDTIVTVAQSLPGYRDWCGHQHEVHQRATEWARCVENSHYFPYGTQQGKYKAKAEAVSAHVETTWNQQRSQTAQAKIQAAMAELFTTQQLPATTTARFQKLVTYGIGGSTLYKYKTLWHPDLWKPPQTPPTSKGEGGSATAAPATPPQSTSLLQSTDRNPLQDNAFNPLETSPGSTGVRNDETAIGWRQVLRSLKVQRSRQKQDQQVQRTAHLASKAQIYAQKQQEKMVAYLQSGDPILVQEALQWLAQQDEVSLEALLPANHRQSVSTAVRMREQQRLTGTAETG